MIILGLTGSIGMGKSTTARMFRDAGIPVHDSDQTVHDLYQGELVAKLEEVFPGVVRNGSVDRQALSKQVVGKPAAFQRLEEIVHPAVRAREKIFLETHEKQDARLAVLDIPLLFETGADDRVDKILVVSAPLDIQRDRVLSRPDMSPEKFAEILKKQMPDDEKRARADFVIDTSKGLKAAKEQVHQIIQTLSTADH